MMGIELRDGARVAIIGGGPAGSFFAHFLLTLGARVGIRPEITIFDRKSFLEHGPKGCNMCAGAIGHHLVEHLRREGIPLPPSVVRQEVDGYVLHAHGGQVMLRQDERPIYTVFRGRSPIPSSEEGISFDQFLLDHAISKGASFRKDTVIEVIWPGRPTDKALVTTKSGGTIEADLVVGAFGVNTGLHRKFMGGYGPPRTWVACQAEMAVDPEVRRKAFGNNIHVFALGERKIKFVALTPKGNFVTVTGIGPSVNMTDLEPVLNRPEFKPYVPEGWRVSCHCHPHFPVTAADRPYRDRGLLVGDACQARYLKNGIESAYFTALFGAQTCLERGVGGAAFAHYHRLCRERFSFDNRCGQALFAMHNAVAAHRRISRAHLLATEIERMRKSRDEQVLANSLWSMFTGDVPYRRILRDLLSPGVFRRVFSEIGRSLIRTDAAWNRYAERRRKRFAIRRGGRPLNLGQGSTVAIIGGGPGGASCAMRLLNRARAAGLSIRVVIFEGKDFDRHYNQCVGVLSPPLEHILRDNLGTGLPEQMIKRRIESYRLYSDEAALRLDDQDDAEPTIAVRRVMFDRFLLKKAEEAGADIVRSRVTGIEFVRTPALDEVRIYSESQYLRADVVVGAFGLDGEMLDRWERATDGKTPYRRPRKLLKTVITKIHTDPAFIEATLGNSIHAFLLSGRRIEFGAVTPKGDHLIVNVAGKEVCSLDLDEFLERPQVRALLPEFDHRLVDYYAGYFPTAPAENPYGRRYVLVGDSTGWMRPFKGKGINTAMITGVRAADVIFDKGFSRRALEAYDRACADLRRDYWYGRIVRRLTRIARRLGLFDAVLEIARSDERLRDILYLAVSGEGSYRDVVHGLLKPPIALKLALGSGRRLYRHMRSSRAPAP